MGTHVAAMMSRVKSCRSAAGTSWVRINVLIASPVLTCCPNCTPGPSRGGCTRTHTSQKHRDTTDMAQVRCPELIGRSDETRALRDALDQAAGGRGGVVLLIGEAGVGKSRLAADVSAVAAARGAAVLTGRAVPYG